jgi:hypothetical protein
MYTKITNAQHYLAHKLVMEYKRIQTIEDSEARLSAIVNWQHQIENYDAKERLQKAC